jgi:hypothetical protein
MKIPWEKMLRTNTGGTLVGALFLKNYNPGSDTHDYSKATPLANWSFESDWFE